MLSLATFEKKLSVFVEEKGCWILPNKPGKSGYVALGIRGLGTRNAHRERRVCYACQAEDFRKYRERQRQKRSA